VAYFKVLSQNFPEGTQKKNTKVLWIVGLLAEIRTRNLANGKREYYALDCHFGQQICFVQQTKVVSRFASK
jgi:hypothetical protein